MIFSVFPIDDNTLYEHYSSQNTSKDSVLELSNYSPSSSYDAFNARILMKFNTSEISQSISSGLIPSNAKYFLTLYCSEAYQLPIDYTIESYAVSSSWQPGVGHFADDPITTSGVSWKYKDSLSQGSLWISGSGNYQNNVTGSYAIIPGGGDWYINSKASQSFSDSPADINMDVTTIFNGWLNNTYENNGLIVKWDESSTGIENLIRSLKFFSIDSHTIFLPKIDIKWDDHTYVTESFSYSTINYLASGRSQNAISYPTITLPEKTNTFTYYTGSINSIITSSSISELTSSFVYYPNMGIINMPSSNTLSMTCSYDGYLSGSFDNSTLVGSSSGYYTHNEFVEYLPVSKSISFATSSGSYIGYFSGSIISDFTGTASGSFSGSLSGGTSYISYEKLYMNVPATNTYYYISSSQAIYATSSAVLQPLNDNKDIVIYPTNLKTYYKQDEKAIIQINSRPRYPEKIYTTGSIYQRNYLLPEESYFSVKDASSEVTVIDFDTNYTKLSCGNQYSGNYFNLWCNSLQPERNYRLLIKTVRGGIEEIFDNKFIFKVVR